MTRTRHPASFDASDIGRTNELTVQVGGDRLIRVLIVDESRTRRARRRQALNAEPGLEVVGEADDLPGAISETRATKPDVVLLGALSSDPDGRDVIDALLTGEHDAKVLVISRESDVAFVETALAAGASGYVLEQAAPIELLIALQEVAAGARYVQPSLGAALIAADAAEKRSPTEDPLTTREHEILQLLVLGHTNREIAKLLVISVRTAETHRSHIMRKLGLQTRADLVRYSLAQGLLSDRT
jgi:two-component system response regulator NreC